MILIFSCEKISIGCRGGKSRLFSVLFLIEISRKKRKWKTKKKTKQKRREKRSFENLEFRIVTKTNLCDELDRGNNVDSILFWGNDRKNFTIVIWSFSFSFSIVKWGSNSYIYRLTLMPTYLLYLFVKSNRSWRLAQSQLPLFPSLTSLSVLSSPKPR